MLRLVTYDQNGKDRFMVINAYGDVLVNSQDTIVGVLAAYCKEYECTIEELKNDEFFIEDFSTLYHDVEHDTYMTTTQLHKEYEEKCSDEEFIGTYPSFTWWMLEIAGKNGTLEKV